MLTIGTRSLHTVLLLCEMSDKVISSSYALTLNMTGIGEDGITVESKEQLQRRIIYLDLVMDGQGRCRINVPWGLDEALFVV